MYIPSLWELHLAEGRRNQTADRQQRTDIQMRWNVSLYISSMQSSYAHAVFSVLSLVSSFLLYPKAIHSDRTSHSRIFAHRWQCEITHAEG